MIIRLAEPCDRDVLLRFIAEMGFNPRDAATWDGLNMLAMTAWEDSTLVGAIPLEPRVLQVGAGASIPTLHETVVAVRPERRGKGLGSQLQQAVLHARPGGAQLATVFREEPDSSAYRWYATNGFVPVAHIDSWFVDAPRQSDVVPDFEVISILDVADRWPAIEDLRCAANGMTPGLLSRRQRPLQHWLSVHPYRGRYSFHAVMNRADNALSGYVLLGVGNLHSHTTRIDILEFCVAEPRKGVEQDLLHCITSLAARNEWFPIRWPLASSDPLTRIAAAAGFIPRWGFDMLARPLDPTSAIALPNAGASDWKYAGIDYA